MKNSHHWCFAVLLSAASGAGLCISASAQQKTIAERLGYPADAKLLILHADDLALAHSVDTASFEALDQKAIDAALKVANEGTQPQDDAYASAWYRREVLPVYLRRLLAA